MMSAHLLDQLTLFRSSRASGSPPPRAPSIPEESRVRRALFGPVDHDANIRFVHEQLARQRQEASQRWNFDFDRDRPIQGRFEWTHIGDEPKRQRRDPVQSIDPTEPKEVGGNAKHFSKSSAEAKSVEEKARGLQDDQRESRKKSSEPLTAIKTDNASAIGIGTATAVTTVAAISARIDSKPTVSASEMLLQTPQTAASRQSRMTDHFTARRRRRRSRSIVKLQQRKSSTLNSDCSSHHSDTETLSSSKTLEQIAFEQQTKSNSLDCMLDTPTTIASTVAATSGAASSPRSVSSPSEGVRRS